MRIKVRTLTLIAMAAACSMAVTASGATPKLPSLGDGTFATDMSLSKPKALKPNGSASLVYPNDSLKLSWGAVPGATTYDVQVSRQPSANVNCRSTTAWQAENILFTHETTELGWVPEQVDEESGKGMWTGTYCWRVRAAGKKPGQWSVSHKFDISWPAVARNLTFYSDEDGPIPRTGNAGRNVGFDTGYLQWDEVAGAARYEVQISNATTFGESSLFATRQTPGNRLLLPQMPDNQYTWRVRPIAGNGVTGNWSSTSTFVIKRDTRYWISNSANLYPGFAEQVSDIKIGWEPVPGASFYHFEAATRTDVLNNLPLWLHYQFGDKENCDNLQARISPNSLADASTINNWVSFGALFDPAVIDELTGDPCEPEGGGAPVTLPFPDYIYWQVRPVWRVSAGTESGWDIDSYTIFGDFVQREFEPVMTDPSDWNTANPDLGMVATVAGSECRVGVAGNTTEEPCVRHVTSRMSPRNATRHSTTMQVPLLEWGAYQAGGQGAASVEIARDELFTQKINPAGHARWITARSPLKRDDASGLHANLQYFGRYHRSMALTTGLPDEGDIDGDGYFWRAIPCQGTAGCLPAYNNNTGAQQSPGLKPGTPGSGALEFNKRVEVDTEVTPNFSAGMPLLKVGPVGAGSDFAKWQRGIQGADHYEFELARNQAFEDARTFKATVPRLVPWGQTSADLLEPGTWFWRVRAVDRDGLKGSWSDRSSFAIKSNAPILLSTSETSGRGVTVEWTTVPGASGYEIAWSADPTFASGVTTKPTAQTAYFIPASSTGTRYWRVRAQIGGATYSEWSEARSAQILAQNRVRFSVNRATVTAGATAIVDAQLLVAGTPTNGKKVMLQRKTTSCASAKGAYRTIKSGVTGRRTTDGHVRYRFKASVSACYRLRAASGSGIVFSAPFKIGAKPTVRFNVLNRTVRRGNAICTRTTSRQRLTGRLRIQYRVGKTWRTARTVNVRNMKSRRQCATISRAGYFPIRVQLDRLNHSKGGYRIYETTTVSSGRVRVNDTYVVRTVR